MSKEKELYDFEAPFVSIVPKGANKKKFFLLKSNDGGITMEFNNEMLVELEEIFKAELSKEVANEITKAKLSEKAENAVKGALKLLNAYKDEVGEDTLKKLAALAGYGYAEPKKQKENDKDKDKDKYPYKYPAEKVKKTILDAVEDEDTKTKVEKAFAEVETGVIEKEDPRVTAILKEKDEIKKQLDEEKSIRIMKEFVEKASAFKNLNASAEELGAILKEASEHMVAANVKKLNEVLAAADKQLVESALLVERGSARIGEGGDTWTKIEKAAEALRKEDPKLTKEESIAKAMEKNPELYAEYEKERRI